MYHEYHTSVRLTSIDYFLKLLMISKSLRCFVIEQGNNSEGFQGRSGRSELPRVVLGFVKRFLKIMKEFDMKKMIVSILLLIGFMTSSGNATTATYNSTARDGFEQRYELIDIHCMPLVCILDCQRPNMTGKLCRWHLADFCDGCLDEKNFFVAADGDNIHQYAVDEFANGVNSGTYSDTYVNTNFTPNRTFSRTVVWYIDIATQDEKIEITITE